jgi:hypothetical protein
MASEFISGYPAPLALPVGTPNGTEIVPADQVVGGVRTTKGFAVSGLLASLAVTYPTGLVTASSGFTVSGGNFTSRGILDQATAQALAISSGGNVSINTVAAGNTAAISTSLVGSYALLLDAPSNNTAGTLAFFNTTTSVVVAELGGGGTVTGQGVNDFAIAPSASGHVIIGTGSGAGIGSEFSSNGAFTNNVSGTTIFSTSATGMFCNTWGSQSGVQTINASSGLTINGPTTINPASGTALTVHGVSVLSGGAVQQLVITGVAVGTSAISIATCATTGAGTGTLIANKPGGNTNTTKWIPIILDGVLGYIPVFG